MAALIFKDRRKLTQTMKLDQIESETRSVLISYGKEEFDSNKRTSIKTFELNHYQWWGWAQVLTADAVAPIYRNVKSDLRLTESRWIMITNSQELVFSQSGIYPWSQSVINPRFWKFVSNHFDSFWFIFVMESSRSFIWKSNNMSTKSI